MTIPFQIGVPQVILFLIALVGLWLFISAAIGLLRRHEHHELEEEKARYLRPRRWYHRPGFRISRGLGGIILLALAVSLLWLTFLVQSYLGLTGDIRVARIHATRVANLPHMMSVELTLYDQNGHQISDDTYILQGDEWMLQGDIIKFPTWLNILGLHSGFKLTRLEGRYDDPQMEANNKHTVIVLNGGDDNFFTTVQQQQWTSPFVDSAYGSSTFLRPDQHTYDVFVSQDALHPEPVKG
jgi:hypothetical protein